MLRSAKGKLVALGEIFTTEGRFGATFEMASEDDCRALAPALELGAGAGVTLKVDVPNEPIKGEPEPPPQLQEHACPACGQPCYAVEVTSPVHVQLLVNPALPDFREGVAFVGAQFVIAPAWVMHATTCPKWPNAERDWRSTVDDDYKHQGDEDP